MSDCSCGAYNAVDPSWHASSCKLYRPVSQKKGAKMSYYEKGMGAKIVAELNKERLTFIGGTGLLAIQLRDTCLFADAAATRIAELVALLTELIDIEGPQPGHVEWFRRVQAAIANSSAQGTAKGNERG